MARAKAIIEEGKAATPEGEISAEGQAFVLDLLKAHSNPAEKTGAGVKAIKVGSLALALALALALTLTLTLTPTPTLTLTLTPTLTLTSPNPTLTPPRGRAALPE